MSEKIKIKNSSFADGKKLGEILVAICTCHKYRDKRNAARGSWLKRIPDGISYKFFCGINNCLDAVPEDDLIQVSSDDGYRALPHKVLSFFEFALENYSFDWIFKCDDDTYVALDRLHHLLDEESQLIGDESLAKRGAPSGGAGYLLSRSVVEKLVKNRSQLAQDGAEDLIIGKAAVSYGITTKSTKRLHWNSHRVPRLNNDQVSTHWITPVRMEIIHTVYTSEPERVFEVKHKHWKDRIMLYGNGSFARFNSSCSGRWRECNGLLYLAWLDWGEEVVEKTDRGFQNAKMTLVQVIPESYPTKSKATALSCEIVSTEYSSVLNEPAIIISLPDSGRLNLALKGLQLLFKNIVISPGVIVERDMIYWHEIRGMEAYNKISYFRGDYIPRALGCRRAGRNALMKGVSLTSEFKGCNGFFVFQDDVIILDAVAIKKALGDMPTDGDCLWLDIGQLTGPTQPLIHPMDLQRISGARLCTGFWIRYEYAEDLASRLDGADCEWDLFMDREMKVRKFYAPLRSLCKQRHGVSQITGTTKW